MLIAAVRFGLQKFPSSSVFFDVGCNAGSFVKVLTGFGIYKGIHCFEPHPVLSRKVTEVYPHVTMNELCLGSSEGTIDIHIPMHSVGLSSIIQRPVFSRLNQPITTLNVKCTTIDAYCKERGIDSIDFIKIDVEGAEKHVFLGARGMLASKKIKCGIFEIGETLTDAGTSAEEICDMLTGYGYTVNKTLSSSDYVFHV